MFVMIGDRFGRLSVEGRGPDNFNGKAQFKCNCDCGNTVMVQGSNLIAGRTSSCGCYKIERATKHGMAESTEYTCWVLMNQRCFNPKAGSFQYYGSRGITVCPEWANSFESFYRDMGPRPSPQHTIERRDVNGDYGPRNCYWATPDVQASNKTNSVYCVIDGTKMTVAEASRKFGLDSSLVYWRLKAGWSDEEAIHGKGKT